MWPGRESSGRGPYASGSPRKGPSPCSSRTGPVPSADTDQLARHPGSPLSESPVSAPVYTGETEAQGPRRTCPGASQRVASAPRCHVPGAGRLGGGRGQTLSAVRVVAPPRPGAQPLCDLLAHPQAFTRSFSDRHGVASVGHGAQPGTPQVSPPGRTSQPGTRGPSLLSRPLLGHRGVPLVGARHRPASAQIAFRAVPG